MNRTSVLFVDDDPDVLEGLENRMRGQRRRWRMHFVAGPTPAMDELEQRPFDVVVSGVRLSNRNGLDFVERLRTHFPRSLRFILSAGAVAKEDYLRLAVAAHQVLAKPCGPRELEEAIERVRALDGLLDQEVLRSLVHRVKALPVVPETYAALQDLLRDPDCDVTRVSELVACDVAISARLLQLVNSAAFARREPARSVEQAVMTLGLSSVKSLVLAMSVFDNLGEANSRHVVLTRRLQQHAVQTAAFVVEHAEPRDRANAYAAAMLHDIGRLVMLGLADYEEVLQGDPSHSNLERERERYGVTHADVGAYLLALWGMPVDVVQATARHHDPPDSDMPRLAALIAAADQQSWDPPVSQRQEAVS